MVRAGNTTVSTTVLIWPAASVQVCSTASATLPAEEAKAGTMHRAATVRARSSTRMPFFLILILTPP
jgi:hypothetical protein